MLGNYPSGALVMPCIVPFLSEKLTAQSSRILNDQISQQNAHANTITNTD